MSLSSVSIPLPSHPCFTFLSSDDDRLMEHSSIRSKAVFPPFSVHPSFRFALLFFFSVFLFLFLFVSISVSCELVIGCIFFYWLFAKKVLCELIEGLGRNRFGRFFCFLLPLFYGNLDWGRIGGFILPFLTILCELIGIKKVSFVFFFSLFGLFLGTLFFFLYLFVVFFPSFSELI